MTSPNETPATATGTESKTGFFDLPRELRDEIYDLALEHERATTSSLGDEGALNLHLRAPEPRLCLVSQRFYSEYEERAPTSDNIRLLVSGSTPTNRFPSAGGFPYAARASAVDVHLVFAPYDETVHVCDYFEHLSEWLTELVKDMSCIRTLHLRPSFSAPPKSDDIDYFARMAQRNVLLLDWDFVLTQQKRKFKSIAPLTKVDVILTIPKLNSDDADATEVEAGNIASWTSAGGY